MRSQTQPSPSNVDTAIAMPDIALDTAATSERSSSDCYVRFDDFCDLLEAVTSPDLDCAFYRKPSRSYLMIRDLNHDTEYGLTFVKVSRRPSEVDFRLCSSWQTIKATACEPFITLRGANIDPFSGLSLAVPTNLVKEDEVNILGKSVTAARYREQQRLKRKIQETESNAQQDYTVEPVEKKPNTSVSPTHTLADDKLATPVTPTPKTKPPPISPKPTPRMTGLQSQLANTSFSTSPMAAAVGSADQVIEQQDPQAHSSPPTSKKQDQRHLQTPPRPSPQKTLRSKRAQDPLRNIILRPRRPHHQTRNHGITAGELQEAGVTMDIIQARVDSGDLDEDNELMNAVLGQLDRQEIDRSDWNRVRPPTTYNTMGRDLMVYCLWEVQQCQHEIGTLTQLMTRFTQQSQVKNTQARIDAEQEVCDKFLALALVINEKSVEDDGGSEV